MTPRGYLTVPDPVSVEQAREMMRKFAADYPALASLHDWLNGLSPEEREAIRAKIIERTNEHGRASNSVYPGA